MFNIEIGESSCDPYMQEIGKFLLDQVCEVFATNPVCEIYEVLGCYNGIVEGSGDEHGINSTNCAEALWDCFGELQEGMQTAFDIAKLCQPKPAGKSPIGLSFLPPLQANMQIAYDEMAAMKTWRTEFFGDSAWVYCNETEFIYFRNYFDSISQMDTVSVTPELLAHRPTNISTDQVASFVARWNSTQNRENGLPYDTTNVINFNIMEDSYLIIDSCEKLAVQTGYASTSVLAQAQMDSLRNYYDRKSGSVCAKVSLKFSQSMTMTRKAFDGTLTINNGHETDPIENILLELIVKNESGENSNDLFQINALSLNELTGINGTGILGPKKSGTAVVRFIPEKGAAPAVAKFYFFGGNLSYKDPYTGEIVTRPLYPVRLQVNHSPDLFLDYFMQRDILGDNALTPEIEPSIPAELGVMINNKGAGAAYGVDLESSQPVIVDNEKGLLVDFKIIGSNLSLTAHRSTILTVTETVTSAWSVR